MRTVTINNIKVAWDGDIIEVTYDPKDFNELDYFTAFERLGFPDDALTECVDEYNTGNGKTITIFKIVTEGE